MDKYTSQLLNLLRTLQDPALVAKFQGKCGVLPLAGSSQVKQNGDVVKTTNKKEKLKNTATKNSNLLRNSVYELRSRTVLSPNVKQNGDVAHQDSSDSDTNSNSTCSETDEASEGVILDTPSESVATRDSANNDDIDFVITNNFWYYLFSIGASIGNEIFYCIFFPSWFWNVDGYVGRRLVLIWCFIMYFGQATKDVVRLPRPSAPPVFKLEKRYELEYGMPSTHAMIGAAFPFSLLLLTMNRYMYLFKLAVGGTFLWCTVVCLSRLYMGMHSVLDILSGLLYAAILVPMIWPFLDVLDNFQLHHPLGPYVMTGVAILAAICYPTLDKWSTARGDTTLILGVMAGVAVGSWLNMYEDIYHNYSGAPPYFVKTPDALWISRMECRMILGAVILFATRFIMKGLTYHLVCYILNVDKKCMKSKQRLIVELPYKFITYFTLSFNAIFTAPVIFRYFGIEKEVIFTEL